MLISKVPEDGEGDVEEDCAPTDDDSHNYQTASELIDFMANNQNFSSNDGDTLTPRDLVLLYKNIDVDAKPILDTKEPDNKKPNRRVDTVVYGEDLESEGSDFNEIYSNEDLQNIILINKEQIDFLNSQSSIENKVCHKLGDFKFQTSANEYGKHFVFKDYFIKEQLKGLNEVDPSMFPTSLLDYVSCKRFEDNYTFYMDNIIRYVKSTIEQLKRISNGDYLTDKAKEKWREVEHFKETSNNNTKVLATSTSIPLHVECKIGGLKSTWDDLVHSAVDVRSLSKVLEKKIIFEIPKLIDGSYTLLSKYCADNLVISCKQENQPDERVDVLLQLKRSETGHVVSNISSIMIVQAAPALQDPLPADGPLPLMYENIDESAGDFNKKVRISELEKSIKEIPEIEEFESNYDKTLETCNVDSDYEQYEEDSDSLSLQRFENRCNKSYISSSPDDMSEVSSALTINLDGVQRHPEASFDMYPDDLRMTIQKLATQKALPEESIEDISQSAVTKKKSPTKIRIKSPYENKSHILEEKKRRKLLEIRERRERKKMALAEKCKITKHKYGKGAVMPQASSSVTKLSISNKSFYESIYGHNDSKLDIKQTNNKNRTIDLPEDVMEEVLENLTIPQETTELSQASKSIDKSYDLEDTITEMMYLNMKQKENDIGSRSYSGVSSDFQTNLNILSQLSVPFETDRSMHDDNSRPATPQRLLIELSDNDNSENQSSHIKEVIASQSTLNIVPSNTPKDLNKNGNDKKDLKKITPSLECRKSIDKIYELVKNMGKDSRNKPQNVFATNASTRVNVPVHRGTSSLQGSDSGTSLKLNVTSSNPSSFSYDHHITDADTSNVLNKKPGSPANVTKVIISSKSQVATTPKSESHKNKDRKKLSLSPTNKIEDNPLKAISQLLHKFENVQRKRLKSGTEQKPPVKKSETSSDWKSTSRLDPKRASQLEKHSDHINRYNSRLTTTKEKKVRPVTESDILKSPSQQIPSDDRSALRSGKKKILDILDEAKEARGEAVRGPSKFNSRLSSLAQPKKTYVQAHSEEYQTKYGRNLITDRLQRLAAAPPLTAGRGSRMANTRNKMKTTGNEAVNAVPLNLPAPPGLPIEQLTRPRRSRNNSPETKERSSIGDRPTYNHTAVPVENPNALKKRMVAVESYVKNHYGHNSSSTILPESRIPKMARAPLLPNDLDIAPIPSSPYLEATAAGSNLHSIIESMISNNSYGLEVLTECLETNSRSSRDKTNDLFDSSKCDEVVSMNSDFDSSTTDIIIKYSYNNNNADDIEQQHATLEEINSKKNCIQPFKSLTKMENYKHVLCSRLSLGTFSKHLMLTNSAATPKSSISKLFLLQSGDTGSLLVKTSISQTDKLLKLKSNSILSKTHWDYQFRTIPMQIATVGYAFPEYNYRHVVSGAPSLPRLKELPKCSHKSTLVTHQNVVNKFVSVGEPYADSHLYKDDLHDRLEHAAERDIQNLVPTVTPNKIPASVCYPNIKTSEQLSNPKEKNNKNESKITQTTTLEEKYQTNITNKSSDVIECTTSLDILVGLLNEIQKITTCQTHITNNEGDECKELETLLNNTAAIDSIESSRYNNDSITSLDKLRGLDSDQSLYSFYISDTGQSDKKDNNINNKIIPWYETRNNNAYHTTIYVDREVNAAFADKEYVNTLTDTPSIIFPITINHSTNMTNTLIGEFSQPSAQSLISLTDYHSTHSNVLPLQLTYSNSPSKNVLELQPQIKCTNNKKNNIRGSQELKETKLLKQKTRCLEKDSSIQKIIIPKNNYSLVSSDFDPVMKIKRNFLVTVYSMLVLTVFAALSFPDVLSHDM